MKKVILSVLIYIIFLGSLNGQFNGNCHSASELEYNDIVSYDFDDLNSERAIGPCTGGPLKKHWFSIIGNGKIIKMRYSISYASDVALFILSGPCDALECIQGGFNDQLLYFQTEAEVEYRFVFNGNFVYSRPELEPDGQFYLKTTSFEPGCLDSLAHVVSVDEEEILSVIDYINACPQITENAKFVSGNNMEFGRGFEVSNAAIFECVIENCAVQN